MKVESLSSSQLKQMSSKLKPALDGFKSQKVMIVGDLCMDEYLMGDVRRISPEAPVPVLEVDRREMRLGLAANVAQNITALGGEACLIGVAGNDHSGEQLLAHLKEAGIDNPHLIKDEKRPTTLKTRVMTGNHHIVRVDHEHRRFLSSDVEEQLLKTVDQELPSCAGVILQDYAKGVFSEACAQAVIRLAKKHGKRVVVDPHRTTPVSYYHGADLFKPNRDEAFVLSGLNIDDLREHTDSVNQVAEKLFKDVGCEHLVLTQGKDGMSLFEENKGLHLPTQAKDVFDVTGAGDTVIATLALSWFSGLDLSESCILANYAAGVVVAQIGCVPCTRDQLEAQL